MKGAMEKALDIKKEIPNSIILNQFENESNPKIHFKTSHNFPLKGLLFGVKDIINVDGYPTRCGSLLPHELFKGLQASCVSKLLNAGAIFAGKTVTAEFAVSDPGETRNPRNLSHTPGGSSSGSGASP